MATDSGHRDRASAQLKMSRPWWVDELPYLGMLLVALCGVAYTSIAARGSAEVWVLLVAVFAVICIAAGWRRADGKQARWRLIWTQGLHWGAVLLYMQVLLFPDVQERLSTGATGFALLALMALGTFLAGVHAGSWRICASALLMAVAVPVIGFFEQSTLLLLPLEILSVAAIIAFIWWRRRRPPGQQSSSPANSAAEAG